MSDTPTTGPTPPRPPVNLPPAPPVRTPPPASVPLPEAPSAPRPPGAPAVPIGGPVGAPLGRPAPPAPPGPPGIPIGAHARRRGGVPLDVVFGAATKAFLPFAAVAVPAAIAVVAVLAGAFGAVFSFSSPTELNSAGVGLTLTVAYAVAALVWAWVACYGVALLAQGWSGTRMSIGVAARSATKIIGTLVIVAAASAGIGIVTSILAALLISSSANFANSPWVIAAIGAAVQGAGAMYMALLGGSLIVGLARESA